MKYADYADLESRVFERIFGTDLEFYQVAIQEKFDLCRTDSEHSNPDVAIVDMGIFPIYQWFVDAPDKNIIDWAKR